MRKAILVWVMGALAFVACGEDVTLDAQGCATARGQEHVDWADVVKVEEVTYSLVGQDTASIDKDALIEIVATTRCKISDEVADPDYELRDGDATFLPPGTELWAISGYDPDFRVGVLVDGEPAVYEADTVEGADTGADLLDIEGKVDYIGINSPEDGTTEIAAIRQPDQVRRLVELVLSAPTEQGLRPRDQDTQRFVAFHLRDGTAVVRAFFPESALLWRGITVPAEFVNAIEDALDGE